MTRKALILLAAGLFSLQATADDSVEDRLRACADEKDDAARLSCYDKASNPPAPPAAPVAEKAPAPATATAAPAPAPAPAPAEDPVAEFGMNPELEAKKPDDEKKKELREISAQVVEVSKRTRGELVVTLDNGQVWTEKDAEPYLRVKVGDTIVIKRNRMGGYRLVGRGNRASAVTRIE
jgi:pyruvate/2-oxoglutarate dehydrogenase complex dihydrolipoamide acyltransferase (E2) component